MPVWPFLMGLAAAVFAAAVVSCDRRYVAASGIILALYILGRVFMAALPSEVLLPAFAFMWIAGAGLVLQCRTRPLIAAAGFMASAGLCYAWAKATGAAWVFLSPPFVASDLCALAAMICMATGVRSDVFARNGRLDSFGHRRNCDSLGRVDRVAQAQKEGPR